jgi:hypothetical protein
MQVFNISSRLRASWMGVALAMEIVHVIWVADVVTRKSGSIALQGDENSSLVSHYACLPLVCVSSDHVYYAIKCVHKTDIIYYSYCYYCFIFIINI